MLARETRGRTSPQPSRLLAERRRMLMLVLPGSFRESLLHVAQEVRSKRLTGHVPRCATLARLADESRVEQSSQVAGRGWCRDARLPGVRGPIDPRPEALLQGDDRIGAASEVMELRERGKIGKTEGTQIPLPGLPVDVAPNRRGAASRPSRPEALRFGLPCRPSASAPLHGPRWRCATALAADATPRPGCAGARVRPQPR